MSEDINDILRMAVRVSSKSAYEKAALVDQLMEKQPQAFLELVGQIEMIDRLSNQLTSSNQMWEVLDRVKATYPSLFRTLQNVSDSQWETIHTFVFTSNKVAAIKELRGATGLDLVTAKNVVENLDNYVRRR